MKYFKIWMFVILGVFVSQEMNAQHKREFRGAWIQAVNGQWVGMGTARMHQTLTYQLNELQKDGVNAIIFQVRPECDALYKSSIEPWSRFLTSTQGVAPQPYWDPLAWMIQECHKRGMELHAWINPYRAKTKTTNELASNHVAIKHPEWIFTYDGLYLLNPAIPACRDYICEVVRDIVKRYDIDGLHIDDYFYPYPVAGVPIPDDREFRTYNNGYTNRGDWRRNNVTLFMEQLYNTIKQEKPWVKFGVSPFGIYRNKKNSAIGSNTNGLQNYDDLYADVLLWVNNGLVDYCVPQIYWEIGNKVADYQELIGWWNRHCNKRPLFIGEDVERTVKYQDPNMPGQHQLPAKMLLHEENRNVEGSVLWYAKAAVDNVGNYGTLLRNTYWKYPALQPKMSFIDGKAPKTVRKMTILPMERGDVLFWTAPKGNGWKNEAVKYVVYRFNRGERVDINDPSKIVKITTDCFYELPADSRGYTYAVTALDRMQNESKAKKKVVR